MCDSASVSWRGKRPGERREGKTEAQRNMETSVKRFFTYFRQNSSLGIFYTIVLHFKQVFYLLMVHWKLTTSHKSSTLFHSFGRHYLLPVYIETSRGLTEMLDQKKVPGKSFLLAMKMAWWFQKLKNVLFFLFLAIYIYLLNLSLFSIVFAMLRSCLWWMSSTFSNGGLKADRWLQVNLKVT